MKARSLLRSTFGLELQPYVDLAKMTVDRHMLSQQPDLSDRHDAVRHLVQQVSSSVDKAGSKSWAQLAQKLSTLHSQLQECHGRGHHAQAARHAAKLSAWQCAILTRLWSILKLDPPLGFLEGTSPSEARGSVLDQQPGLKSSTTPQSAQAQASLAQSSLEPLSDQAPADNLLAEARKEDDPVTTEINELFCLLGAFQVLPQAARDCAAASIGQKGCTAMLQRLLELNEGTPATDTSKMASSEEDRQLVEILVDDGLPTLLRFSDGTEKPLDAPVPAATVVAALERLEELEASSGELRLLPLLSEDAALPGLSKDQKIDIFKNHMRSGIPGTLHRIAAICGHDNSVVGLTLRIGRHRRGFAWPLSDIMGTIEKEMRRPRHFSVSTPGHLSELSPSVLLIGGPGTGKTTVLRDIASELSNRHGLGRQCIVVDSSSEIGGYGRVCLRFCILNNNIKPKIRRL